MKKLLAVRNLLVFAAVLFGLLVLIFSFMTNVKGFDGDGNLTNKFFNVVWGCKKQEAYANVMGNDVTVKTEESFNALLLPLIGAILALVGGLAACVALFLVKDAKTRKLVVLVAALLMVAGAVMIFLTKLDFFNVYSKKLYDEFPQAYRDSKTLAEFRKDLKDNSDGTMKAPLAVVSGILALVGGLSAGASQFVPEK